MYIVKAEADQVEKIVDMSISAFETDVNVGGGKGECPPEFDSVEWHKQMARDGHLYQAMIGKDLVGAAIIFPDETKNSVYIGRIFIDSIYHRKGYGIRLMECIEKDFPCAAEFNLDTPWISHVLLSLIWIPHAGMSGQKHFTKDWAIGS